LGRVSRTAESNLKEASLAEGKRVQSAVNVEKRDYFPKMRREAVLSSRNAEILIW
jgi:hypothetical protein